MKQKRDYVNGRIPRNTTSLVTARRIKWSETQSGLSFLRQYFAKIILRLFASLTLATGHMTRRNVGYIITRKKTRTEEKSGKGKKIQPRHAALHMRKIIQYIQYNMTAATVQRGNIKNSKGGVK
ncbi:uncharacterized protein SPSK_00930 [Sporothrix schenckii 1099-18]|uniref:Uncharacterized protein n=1 Tax=Sporothrix schenckii 1099-18 TaxID=1397361 RepID=A0A0F2M131_SPOSC|nr:uncharacterized protein SPSK_00930 [Sporothrix schenckii 1099-18]KJR81866.1 hypothetical protein SPSK_00930 [Sporothrix schenckii 1099-18]